ncbi:MAG: hypothetical protein JRG97_07420 [Deltaproteobacteria bacterium]|nr:hypothetical protein [Deltaproteobacteria bacterium]MBW2052060.1 hypothetical protein [Deltaproteobacteria bacterium]MBW2140887.1 hypothetical protein [Deltaproteobacteria bacterium]MBW2322100.1 hypothetical protein [Deltaproteobacteria bacterium]
MKAKNKQSQEVEKRKEENIWEEDYAIRTYETDSTGRLSIISLCHLMQDAAEKHALKLGLAIQDLQSENLTWVLSRLALKVDSYPGWQDQIQVHTWPSGIKRLFALRDFRITDQSNHLYGAATSAWLIINAQTRRPIRIQRFIDKLNITESNRALPHGLDKLPALDQHKYEQRFRVRHRDLDLNQHVNNVSYIEWVVESIPAKIQTKGVLTELEINFQAEAHFGDHVISRCTTLENDRTVFLHSIVREEDEQEVIRARTVWK